MQLPLLLLIGSLVSQPAPAQWPAARSVADHPAGGPRQGTLPGYGGTFTEYPGTQDQGPSFDYVLPRPETNWALDGVQAVPPGQRRYPSPGDPDYGAPPEQGATAWPKPGTGPSGPGVWTGQGGEGFRFRGDKESKEGAWVDSKIAPGFKFRPLAPAEMERSSAGDGWRPLGRDDKRPPEPPGLPSDRNDALGYEADSWFRKYYGDRP